MQRRPHSRPTVVAAGADDVSEAVASVFGAHGQAYQTVSAQAATFHEQFVQLLNAAANIGYGNTGSGNIGFGNYGTDNIGLYNSGISNFGVVNRGYYNFGGWNTGLVNLGLGNYGSHNIGIAVTGAYRIGIGQFSFAY